MLDDKQGLWIRLSLTLRSASLLVSWLLLVCSLEAVSRSATDFTC